jgi:YHS domain-containing protein
MIRLILYGILFYVGYRILKPWVTSLMGSGCDEPRGGSSSQEAELIRDPQCGTYFLTQRGVAARVGGRSVYFCSKECRDKYLMSHKES